MAQQKLPSIQIGTEKVDGPWLESRINEILNDADIHEDEVKSEHVTIIAFHLIKKLHDLESIPHPSPLAPKGEPLGETPDEPAGVVNGGYLCEICEAPMSDEDFTILGGTCDNCHCA